MALAAGTTVIIILARDLLYLARMPQLSEALIRVLAGQRPGFQSPLVNKINYSMLFPLLLLLGNICAAICYAISGEWKRALYWAASSVCIASITF